MKITKVFRSRSTNPNTGEETINLRAKVEIMGKTHDMLIYSPNDTVSSLKEKFLKDKAVFVEALRVVATAYGDVLMLGTTREVLEEWDV
jgi:hypothetical protein